MDCVLIEKHERRFQAQQNLVLPTLYNIRDLEDGIFLELFK